MSINKNKLADSPVKFASWFERSTFSNCPVCHSTSNRVKLYISDNNSTLCVYRCRCGTIFYPNAKAQDYEVVENKNSFFMRIDQFEGIDSALMPLFTSPNLNEYSVIDIGCGLGFTSSYIRYLGRECFALDPSSAAKMSTQELLIDISSEYASPENTFTTNKKLVFASEVIEHVDDPLEFLKTIKVIAGESGYAILTTPNAEFVHPRNHTNTILTILAPSQHLFLLSKSSLKMLAEKVGFAWIHIWTHNERLFMIAGPCQVEISNCFSRKEYTNYLQFQLSDSRISPIIRYRSYGYRLFKELVNSGSYIEAEKILSELTVFYAELNLDLSDPGEIVATLKAASGKVGSRLPDTEKFPYNLALLMYLQGVLKIAHEHDRIAAKPFFQAAIAISELYRDVFSDGIFQLYDLEMQNVKDWALNQISLHSLN